MKIDQITIAITKIKEMVTFYEKVFKIDFQKREVHGSTLYSGQLAGINLLLCPNEIAGVDAQQNRQQFDYIVNDIQIILKEVQNYGGQLKGEIVKDKGTSIATVTDPDGNTMVFKQT